MTGQCVARSPDVGLREEMTCGATVNRSITLGVCHESHATAPETGKTTADLGENV